MKRVLILFVLSMILGLGAQAQCSTSGSFTVVLKTTGGTTVTKVDPNTTYNVVITGPTSPAGVNVCYAVFNMIRCATPHASDTSSGVCQLSITTHATKIGTGISFAIAPPDSTIDPCDCTNPDSNLAFVGNYLWN